MLIKLKCKCGLVLNTDTNTIKKCSKCGGKLFLIKKYEGYEVKEAEKALEKKKAGQKFSINNGWKDPMEKLKKDIEEKAVA